MAQSANNEWPLPAFYFEVRIGNSGKAADCAFQEVSGLDSQIETEEFREGGNNIVYYLPKTIKQGNITLKRGIANIDSTLIKWCKEVFDGQLNKAISTQTVSVRLLNEKGNPRFVWSLDNTYPTSWKVETFQATKNEVAIEEIVLSVSRARRSQ